jgi:hypothetical protein
MSLTEFAEQFLVVILNDASVASAVKDLIR